MPADAPEQRVPHGNIAARRDIRRAEASRMLGLLRTSELPERARLWLADGADSVGIRALAGGELGSDGIQRALLKGIADEFGLGFSTRQDARRFEAEEILRSRHLGQDVTLQIYALSNGYTDELVQWLRRVVARLIHR